MIVGIGASAGGLDALKAFVGAIPEASGLAYVVVQHLSPDHSTLIDQLLTPNALVPVRKIADGDVVAPDIVWILPPGMFLEVEDGHFRLRPHVPEEGPRSPIDRFFFSLAQTHQDDAFAIVLSGTGSDGAKGIRAIKAHGGVALVQESASARFAGMPESAAATGVVDFVLRPEAMPTRIAEIVAHRRDLATVDAQGALTEAVEAALPRVLAALDANDAHSFSNYKPGTLVRRISRRMALLREARVDAYITRLGEDAGERRQLAADFLIGVTAFFRDPESYEALRPLIRDRLLASGRENLRVWVPGCSTGEEAYSLAMLFTEEMETVGAGGRLQVFGTDIDVESLRFARDGVYGANAVANLSEERRARFFTGCQGGIKVSAALREACVFAPHNLLRDPPFSRLDLISCRNMLIYLTSAAQKTLFPRFHYALNPGGLLTLGPSETTGQDDRHFQPIDRAHRIFARDEVAPSGFSALGMRVATVPAPIRPGALGAPLDASPPAADPADEPRMAAERQFLSALAAPFAVIGPDDGVCHFSEGMTRFVRPQSGAPSLTLETLLQPALRLPAVSAVGEARETAARAVVANVTAELDGRPMLFDVAAEPLEGWEGCVLLAMQPVRREAGGDAAAAPGDQTLQAAERELAITRQSVSSLRRRNEAAEQELRGANEELLSMNEELQSSNEELETSREELQSINEELEMINAELNENNTQLIRANSDLRNLLESTGLPTLFLDRRSRVRLFTPELRSIVALEDRDLGRPITDLAFRVRYPELLDDAAAVQAHLTPVTREVHNEDTDETFSVRVRPYRGDDNKLDGCVFTFIDVTERQRDKRQIEQNAKALEAQLAELETLYRTVPVGLALHDRDLRFLRVNDALARINGLPVEAHHGRRGAGLLPDLDEQINDCLRSVLETGESIMGVEIRGKTPSGPGRTREWIADYYPIHAGDTVVAVGACVREVTEERALQEQARRNREKLFESEARLARLFDQAPALIAIMEGPDHRYIYSNNANDVAVGGREILGHPIRDAIPEFEGTDLLERLDAVFETGRPSVEVEFEVTLSYEDRPDETHWYRQLLHPWFDADGAVGGVMGFAYDVTAEVTLRREVEAGRQRLQKVQDSLAAFVGLTTPDGTLMEVNQTALGRAGITREEVIGKPMWEVPAWAWDAAVQERLRHAVQRAAAGESVAYEETVAMAHGERVLVEFNLTPIRDENGVVTELVPSAIDVTQRRAAERSLIGALEEAKAANEAKSRFLAMMSHEIRTPLNGVMGMADVLGHALSDERHKGMLAVIRDSGETLLHLLNDILDFSKIEAGAFELETAPFRLSEVFDRVEATFRARAAEKDLLFTVGLDKPDAVCVGDSHRIGQILNNIVSNAIKFTERGAVTVHASLATAGRLRIVVRDTGIGMTEDQVARVFEEFAQADSSTTRRFGGSGLGMAITRRLVDMFGGTIDIDSAPGEGTTIAVSIPIRTPEFQLGDGGSAPEAASMKGLRVLAVDDNEVNRQVLGALLYRLGAEAEMVATGGAFLAALEAAPRDVVMIDISMPGMDGIEVIKTLRAAETRSNGPPTVALACTASVMPEEVRFYRASGFDGVLAKPISVETLSDEVTRALRARGRGPSEGDDVAPAE